MELFNEHEKGIFVAFRIITQVKKKTNEHESFVMRSQQEAEMGHNQPTLREALGNVKYVEATFCAASEYI